MIILKYDSNGLYDKVNFKRVSRQPPWEIAKIVTQITAIIFWFFDHFQTAEKPNVSIITQCHMQASMLIHRVASGAH